MARFTIELPENKTANVWRLIVSSVKFSDTYDMESMELISESGPKTTIVAFKYVVTISNGESNNEYFVFKSANGDWFRDVENKEPLDDGFLILLKNAIIKRENEINKD